MPFWQIFSQISTATLNVRVNDAFFLQLPSFMHSLRYLKTNTMLCRFTFLLNLCIFNEHLK